MDPFETTRGVPRCYYNMVQEIFSEFLFTPLGERVGENNIIYVSSIIVIGQLNVHDLFSIVSDCIAHTLHYVACF